MSTVEANIAAQFRPVKCFVIMPSGRGGEYRGGTREADYIYEQFIKRIVEDVAKHLNLTIDVQLSVRNSAPAIITEEIIDQLQTADLVVADLTGKNPNVYYELGIRYALDRLGQRATIPIIQEDSDLAFDLRGVRAVIYAVEPWEATSGYDRIRKSVIESLEAIAKNKRTLAWNPVQRVVYGERSLEMYPSAELVGKAAMLESTWRFRKPTVAIIASSTKTEATSHLKRHFLLSTGSGQFFSLGLLLPPLSLAYPFSRVNLYLSKEVEENDLVNSDLILLGGATNKRTQDILKQVKTPFDYHAAEADSEAYSKVVPRLNGYTEPFTVKTERTDDGDRVTEDFGIVMWTHRPNEPESRILIAFGGTTYGTEAAVRFVVEPRSAADLIRNVGESKRSIAFAMKTRVEGHRCGQPIGQPVLLGEFE